MAQETVIDQERDEARGEADSHRDDPTDTEGRCPNERNHTRILYCGACESWFGAGG